MEDRIKQVRQSPEINMSQEAFGKRLGLTGAAISRMESGQRNPSEHVILSICREYGVNENWLRTGEGEMFVKTVDDTIQDIVRSYGLGEEDRIVLEEFVELPPAARKSAIQYLRRVAARLDELNPQENISGAAGDAPQMSAEERMEHEARAEADEYYHLLLMEKRQNAEKGALPAGTGDGSSISGGNIA